MKPASELPDNQLFNTRRKQFGDRSALKKLNPEDAHLLRIAAHDLRNPVAGILSASEYLLENLPQVHEEEHVALLQAIQASSQFMLQLLENVMEINAGRTGTPFQFQPTDLVSLVKQVVILNRVLAERKRIHLDLTADDAMPLIHLDAQKIHQVVDNLVTNAIKFSSPDSGIEIHVGVRGSLAILTVQDHGLGIPPEEVEAVRGRFNKCRKKTVFKTAVASLGLAIIRQMVEGHGGKVRLQSELGRGSTFTISLPITQPEKSRSLRRGSDGSRTGKEFIRTRAAG